MYHKENPNEVFPSYRVLRDGDFVPGIRRALEISSDASEESFWNSLKSKGESIAQVPEYDLLRILQSHDISDAEEAAFWKSHFGELADMPVFHLDDLAKVLEYVYLESASDLFIFDLNFRWYIFLDHEGWAYSRIWKEADLTCAS